MSSSGLPSRSSSAGLPPDESVAVGPGCSFDGTLAFRGTVRVEGQLRGRVVASGKLIVAEGARLEAAIDVDEICVAGEIEGDVRARQRAEIRSTARVAGSLQSPRLVISEGGWVEGRFAVGAVAAPPVADRDPDRVSAAPAPAGAA
jgi:cytoskeletal protein CcmA (bactofilin family)